MASAHTLSMQDGFLTSNAQAFWKLRANGAREAVTYWTAQAERVDSPAARELLKLAQERLAHALRELAKSR